LQIKVEESKDGEGGAEGEGRKLGEKGLSVGAAAGAGQESK
jgi:hypothetical protein